MDSREVSRWIGAGAESQIRGGHAHIEQCSLTGGSFKCFAMSAFLSVLASSKVLPLSHSVAYEDDAMAEPHPNVCAEAWRRRPMRGRKGGVRRSIRARKKGGGRAIRGPKEGMHALVRIARQGARVP